MSAATDPLPVPELVIQVRSPTDRWLRMLATVSEDLEAGVKVVSVLDDETHAAYLFHAEVGPRVCPLRRC